MSTRTEAQSKFACKAASAAEIDALVGSAHSLGSIEVCVHCGARFWPEERTTNAKFNLCCMGGRVHGSMPPLLDYPALS